MYVRSPLSVYLLLQIAYKFSTNRLDFCPFVRSSGVYSGLIHSQGRRILISFQPTRKHITMITGPKVNWSLIQMVPQSNQFNNEFAQFNLSSFCKILQDSSLRTIWHTGVFWTSVLNLSGCFEQERQWKLSSFSSLLFFSSPSLPPPALAETPISRRQRLLLLSSPTEQILPRFDVWRLLWLS